MIVRTWRGWASSAEGAARYEEHYRTSVATALSALEGFVEARLLRAEEGDEVAFTSVVTFTSMDAVSAFAGDDPGRAVVEEEAQRALSRWDDRVVHHDLVARVGRARSS